MGVIWAKLRRKKTNTEVLERLDKDIRSIEDYSRNTEQKHKKIVGQFLLFSIGLYIVTTFLFFFYFFPPTVKERVLYFIPIILAPIIITCTKKLLTWYYNRKLTKNQRKLVDLRDEKKKLLEQIMETETYKVARTLLEKYAPEQVRKVSIPVTSSELTPRKALNTSEVHTGVRNRFPGGKPMGRPSIGNVPSSRSSFGPAGAPSSPITARAALNTTAPPTNNQIVPHGSNQVQLPQAILPRERSMLDRMVEYLVGDGPSNRYALICSQCSCHNGMALKQEFEYISFKCCYCFAFNPAHKKRPVAPKLEPEATSPDQPSDSSDSEKNSGSDSDDDRDAPPPASTPKPIEVETLYTKEHYKTSDTEPASDFDKLSDIELKNSDSELAEKPDDDDHQSKQDSQD